MVSVDVLYPAGTQFVGMSCIRSYASLLFPSSPGYQRFVNVMCSMNADERKVSIVTVVLCVCSPLVWISVLHWEF